MGLACTAEIPERQWNFRITHQIVGFFVERRKRADPVVEHRTKRTRLHLFEPKRQSAVDRAAFDGLTGEEQGRGPG